VVTAYFQIHSWNNRWVVNRENIYKTTNTDDGTYSWSDVKVLDFRDFNYTEKYPPVALQGINCNSLAKNVTTVYLPSTTTIILNTSFTGGWKSLDTVYIPKGVTEISYDAFNGCPVKNVIIEENSQIKSIGDNAFRGCDITSFDFANTALLETIGYCAFYTSDLSGKVVLPNSVTSIGDGAFRSTQIETLVLGDGPVCLGYNLVGNDGGTSKTNLKEVYISAKSTFNEKKLSEIWFSNGSTINFYVIGSNDEVSEFIPKLKNTGRVKFATEEEIQNGTAVSGYNAVIITGYNICDAFYDSKHTFSDTPDFVYENAITEFYQENACLNCNNKYKTGDTYAPVLKFSGYSIKNDGSAFCVGYSVN
ncbi:MAG: leucine-rich repeat domain-containing protein, partial [Clostridia bacterium]|nr:leucine-rich repeat domain-containing protein [Clostridia bacterium]